jgi:hypothetical protein
MFVSGLTLKKCFGVNEDALENWSLDVSHTGDQSDHLIRAVDDLLEPIVGWPNGPHARPGSSFPCKAMLSRAASAYYCLSSEAEPPLGATRWVSVGFNQGVATVLGRVRGA